MERRDFVTSAIAMAGAALSGGEGRALAQPPREFYQLRKYALRTGTQLALVQNYFEHALIPALNRMAVLPVGAFKLDVGPETPNILFVHSGNVRGSAGYVGHAAGRGYGVHQGVYGVLGSAGVGASLCAGGKFADVGVCGLAKDRCAEGRKKGFFSCEPMRAQAMGHMSRRSGCSTKRKIGIFTRTGLTPVFFGDTLIGPRMPSLTYMLTFADVADLNEKWAVFGSDPAWKELSHRPHYTDAEIVSNISNLYLSPLACSQI